jgi:outer membrane protein assembly factor BamD
MKRKNSLILMVLLVLAGVSACKTEYDRVLEGSDVDAKYKAAFEYFNAGKYTRAAQLFESLSLLTNGSERHDTVMYYLGLSNYSNKDYYTAETNFQQYLTYFPQSTFTEMAEFLRIDCLYRATLRYELDQTPTYAAINAIGEYLREHPTGANADICRHRLEELSERLDRKAFENARLYYKMEDYLASRVALKNVLKDNAENVFREEILYYTAMSSYKYALLSVREKQKERYLVFQDDYLNFVGEFPESPHRKELDALYNKVKEK